MLPSFGPRDQRIVFFACDAALPVKREYALTQAAGLNHALIMRQALPD